MSYNVVANTALGSNIKKLEENNYCVNGVIQRMLDTNITLPNSPTVTHADSSNSGMILNGRDMVDASGWLTGSGTLAAVNGNLQLTADGLTTWSAMARQVFPTVIGQKYTVEFSNIDNCKGISIIGSGTSLTPQTGAEYYYPNLNGHYKVEFIAEDTSADVRFLGNSAIDAVAVFGNIFMCPSSEISRSDLVFLETWHEDIGEKDFVYPLGNIQYLGADIDSITGIVVGAFAGKETYSNFGNWQADNALVGKGYVWSTMSEANKIAFVSNPENNCYIDGTTVVQVRYRVRVVQGLGDEWENVDTQIPSVSPVYTRLTYKDIAIGSVSVKGKKTALDSDFNGSSYWQFYSVNGGQEYTDTGAFVSKTSTGTSFGYSGNDSVHALPIALVHRRNFGAFHVKFNSNGTKAFLNKDGTTPAHWYNTDQDVNNIADCFDV